MPSGSQVWRAAAWLPGRRAAGSWRLGGTCCLPQREACGKRCSGVPVVRRHWTRAGRAVRSPRRFRAAHRSPGASVGHRRERQREGDKLCGRRHAKSLGFGVCPGHICPQPVVCQRRDLGEVSRAVRPFLGREVRQEYCSSTAPFPHPFLRAISNVQNNQETYSDYAHTTCSPQRTC